MDFRYVTNRQIESLVELLAQNRISCEELLLARVAVLLRKGAVARR
jgi:hypothetical protein